MLETRKVDNNKIYARRFSKTYVH